MIGQAAHQAGTVPRRHQLRGQLAQPGGPPGPQRGAPRRERLRRLRMCSRYASVVDCEFDAHARARRKRLRGRIMVDPVVTGFLLAPLVGPENVAAEVFSEAALKAVLA